MSKVVLISFLKLLCKNLKASSERTKLFYKSLEELSTQDWRRACAFDVTIHLTEGSTRTYAELAADKRFH